MSDIDALLANICLNPSGHMPRLVYADWLEEHNYPKRAELIRIGCKIASMVQPMFVIDTCQDGKDYNNKYIRADSEDEQFGVTIECDEFISYGTHCDVSRPGKIPSFYRDMTVVEVSELSRHQSGSKVYQTRFEKGMMWTEREECYYLSFRERELISQIWTHRTYSNSRSNPNFPCHNPRFQLTIDRGLESSIWALDLFGTFDDFCISIDSIIGTPITEVSLNQDTAIYNQHNYIIVINKENRLVAKMLKQLYKAEVVSSPLFNWRGAQIVVSAELLCKFCSEYIVSLRKDRIKNGTFSAYSSYIDH